MNQQLLDIESKAKKLSVKERELLAGRLLAPLAGAKLSQVEAAWVEEAERRFSSYQKGERKGIPAEKVFRQIRKKLLCQVSR